MGQIISGAFSASGAGILTPGALRVIGLGPSFPFAFTGQGTTNTVSETDGLDKINQSIWIILTTRPGERVMNPEFGSRLPDLVFEPNDSVLKTLLTYYTVAAIRRWEARITVTATTFPATDNDIDNGIIRIRIVYTVNQTNTPGSFVFPFQRQPMPQAQLVSGNPVPAPNAGSATLASPALSPTF